MSAEDPTPHIEVPPTRPDVPENGLCCWRQADRICGLDCVAYQDDTQVPEGRDYRDAEGEPFQWARCRVLTDQHKQSKYLVVLGQAINTHLTRLAQLPAPGVR